MNPGNPLESIYYINIPENFNPSNGAFQIDKTIQLPVQRKTNEDPGNFNPEEITTEQILAGILIFSFCKNLKEIKLAIDAIKVPKPPIFTPIRSSLPLLVKPDNKILAGTLEKIWLDNTPTHTSLPIIMSCKKLWMEFILPKLPIKINRNTKVKIRL